MAWLSPTRTRLLCASLGAVLLLSSLSFALSPVGGDDLRPVAFDDTVTAGGTGVDIQRARAEGFLLPRAEVFYSNYRYVVGYYGVGTTASELADPDTEGQFGSPLAVYVSDFSTVTPALTNEGFVVSGDGRTLGWTAAGEAAFVVGSEARVPSGPV
ncbi:copper ABC transporter substrate-binding protein, partial [Halobium palmae]